MNTPPVPNESLNSFSLERMCIYSIAIWTLCPLEVKPPRVFHRDTPEVFGVLCGPLLLSNLPLFPIHFLSPDSFIPFPMPFYQSFLQKYLVLITPSSSSEPQNTNIYSRMESTLANDFSSIFRLEARAGFTPLFLSSCENSRNPSPLHWAPKAWLTLLFGTPLPPHNSHPYTPGGTAIVCELLGSRLWFRPLCGPQWEMKECVLKK